MPRVIDNTFRVRRFEDSISGLQWIVEVNSLDKKAWYRLASHTTKNLAIKGITDKWRYYHLSEMINIGEQYDTIFRVDEERRKVELLEIYSDELRLLFTGEMENEVIPRQAFFAVERLVEKLGDQNKLYLSYIH